MLIDIARIAIELSRKENKPNALTNVFPIPLFRNLWNKVSAYPSYFLNRFYYPPWYSGMPF